MTLHRDLSEELLGFVSPLQFHSLAIVKFLLV
jgi:hypothetical protein